MASLNHDIIERIALPAFSLSIQQRIADILSAYDDLIAVNERRIAILEEMARRVFEAWFLNVDGTLIRAEDLITFNPKLAVDKMNPVTFVPMGSLGTGGMVIGRVAYVVEIGKLRNLRVT